nr:hypothetical protein [Clostridia bacterium]
MNNLLYLNAAATTAIISAATAAVVALGAWFRIQWRKIKGNKQTVKANQEKEEDLVITEDTAEKPEEDKADKE